MATFKEAIQEQNRVAHTQVLRTEYEIISEALSSTSKKNSLIRKENESLLVLQEEIKKENERVRQNTNELTKQTDEKIQTLESKEQEITSRYNEKEASCKSLEQDSRDKVLKLKDTEALFRSVIYDQEQVMNRNSQLISFQEHEIKTNGLTLEDIHVKILQSKGELRGVQLTKTQELNNLDKQIKDKSTELETVSKLVQDERDKISKPMELLHQANREINQKKADLDIYKNQLDDHWEDILRRKNK